jgi:hypothetical protein
MDVDAGQSGQRQIQDMDGVGTSESYGLNHIPTIWSEHCFVFLLASVTTQILEIRSCCMRIKSIIHPQKRLMVRTSKLWFRRKTHNLCQSRSWHLLKSGSLQNRRKIFRSRGMIGRKSFDVGCHKEAAKAYKLMTTRISLSRPRLGSFMLDMMEHPSMIRNVMVAGHLHHGKTSLLDMLVLETHQLTWDADEPVSYSSQVGSRRWIARD